MKYIKLFESYKAESYEEKDFWKIIYGENHKIFDKGYINNHGRIKKDINQKRRM